MPEQDIFDKIHEAHEQAAYDERQSRHRQNIGCIALVLFLIALYFFGKSQGWWG
jgi:hypothetical protein